MRFQWVDLEYPKRRDSGHQSKRADFYNRSPHQPKDGPDRKPKKLTQSEKNSGNAEENSSKNKAQAGWEIRYFLNAAIGVNDLVQLESKVANGIFRVESVKLEGDNMSGDWLCTAQIVEAAS